MKSLTRKIHQGNVARPQSLKPQELWRMTHSPEMGNETKLACECGKGIWGRSSFSGEYFGLNQTLLFQLISSCPFWCKKETEDELQIGNNSPREFTVSVNSDENSTNNSWTTSTDHYRDDVNDTHVLETDILLTGSNALFYLIDDLTYNTIYSGLVMADYTHVAKREVEFNYITDIFPNNPTRLEMMYICYISLNQPI